jgi:hypothetical protein
MNKYLCVGIFLCLCEYPVVLAPFVDKAILFPSSHLCAFVKDQLTVCVWVCFWALCPTDLLSAFFANATLF